MVRILRSRAKSFLVVGWIFFVLSVPICLFVGATAGFDLFYFPTHKAASLNAYNLRASNFILAAGAFAAVASSIAYALKFRATASMLVVVIWSTVIVGSQVARSFVRPGPEYFERHLGPEVFVVPWQYAPGSVHSADEDPHQLGLSVKLCLSDLKGQFDKGCRVATQLYVLPKEQSFADFDLEFWRKYGSQMSPEPESGGYQVFAHSYAAPIAGLERVTHYFVRRDSSGRLISLIVCRLNRGEYCTHHSLVGDYWLRYDAPLADGDTLDGKLAALIESWRRKKVVKA